MVDHTRYFVETHLMINGTKLTFWELRNFSITEIPQDIWNALSLQLPIKKLLRGPNSFLGLWFFILKLSVPISDAYASWIRSSFYVLKMIRKKPPENWLPENCPPKKFVTVNFAVRYFAVGHFAVGNFAVGNFAVGNFAVRKFCRKEISA